LGEKLKIIICDHCGKEALTEKDLQELRAGNNYYGQFCDDCLKRVGTLIHDDHAKFNPAPICVNPHERIYRGCTDECGFFDSCLAKGKRQ
jgi:transcription elongation factor Elf1